MLPSVDQSLLLAKHLETRDHTNPDWIRTLDQLFLSAAYERREGTPFFLGPDGWAYAAFHVAVREELAVDDVNVVFEQAITWATGGVIYLDSDTLGWVYQPGEFVSIAQFGTSWVPTSGDWGELPKLEDYRGSKLSITRPDPTFFSPLAARCLEFYVRKIYLREPGLQDRVPSIAVLRPDSRTLPEQASDWTLNMFDEDFEDRMRHDKFIEAYKRYLPFHLKQRLITPMRREVPESSFTPLTELIQEGGLQPVPSY